MEDTSSALAREDDSPTKTFHTYMLGPLAPLKSMDPAMYLDRSLAVNYKFPPSSQAKVSTHRILTSSRATSSCVVMLTSRHPVSSASECTS